MLPTAIVVIFLAVHIISNEENNINGFYSIKTNEYPKSLCSKIANIRSTRECLKTCIITADVNVMISHDKSTKTCMCCSDFTGDDIIGPNWKSHVPHTYGYFTYNYTNTQICLKYVSTPSTYLEATAYCHADGGDLIRIDRKRKHDIVTDYLLPIANGSTIDVWIQGTKVRTEWFFHDGSKMPEDFDAICPLALNNNVNEKHLRVHGSSTFSCWDMVSIRKCSFLCEQYRQSTIYE